MSKSQYRSNQDLTYSGRQSDNEPRRGVRVVGSPLHLDTITRTSLYSWHATSQVDTHRTVTIAMTQTEVMAVEASGHTVPMDLGGTIHYEAHCPFIYVTARRGDTIDTFVYHNVRVPHIEGTGGFY